MSTTAVPFGDIRDAAERIQQAGLLLTGRRVLIDTEIRGNAALDLVCSIASGRSNTVDTLDVDQVDAVARVLEALVTLEAGR